MRWYSINSIEFATKKVKFIVQNLSVLGPLNRYVATNNNTTSNANNMKGFWILKPLLGSRCPQLAIGLH